MKKLQIRVRDLSNVGNLINRCFVVAVLCCLSIRANAAISVGAGGSAIQSFDTLPAVGDWSFRNIAGAAGDIADATGALLDAQVQTNAAADITTVLASSTANPPAASATAVWSSTGMYVSTRPTGNWFTLLMATLQNDSGSAKSSVIISYDYTYLMPVTEEPGGWRVFYSLTGAAGSWTLIPEFSNITASGPLSATLSVGSWANGSPFYILWADDNGSGSPDTSLQIDNLSAGFGGPPVPITITRQPTNTTVLAGRSFTLSVVASGSSPITYQWTKGGTPITGATAASYTVTNAIVADSGVYRVTITNPVGTTNSANATVTVSADTAGPTLVSALGNAAGDQVTLTFNEPLDVGTGAENSNYEIFLTAGGGDLLVSLAAITNGSNVVITTDPSTPRNPGENYSIRISNVTDLFGNAIAPNPTTRAIAPEIVVIASDGTQPWRYDETGADLSSAGWQAPGYNDSSWLTGNATFSQNPAEGGLPANYLDAGGQVPSPILLAPSGTPPGPITVYFRTHFTLPAAPSNATVRIFHRIDDGAVFYVNGVEVGRFNMPAGAVTSATLAVAALGEPYGESGPIVIPTTNLLNGDNVLAVEVHQNAQTSSDIVMGVRILATVTAFIVGPPTITSQPQSLAVDVGQSASFSVGVTGGLPFTYQWRKGGVAIAGATSSSYTIASVAQADAGTYTVAITNSAGGVISQGATLTVNQGETTPPTIVAVSGSLNFTNFTISFSERLNASASNAANYIVRLTNGSGALTVVSAVVNNNTNVVLTTSTPRSSGQDYSIVISNIADVVGNVISPNPTVRTIPADTIILAFTNAWKYFLGATTNVSGGTTNGDLTGTGWEARTYNDASWLSGPAGLGHESDLQATNPPVIGIPGTNAIPIRTHIDYIGNSAPIYFRAHFNLSSTTGITLNLRDLAEDGAIYYLNGQEAFRNNVAATSAVNFATRAAANTATDPGTPVSGPFSLPTTNLVVGDNVIAVQLVQSGASSSDAEFAAELSLRAGPISGPRINITYNANGTVTLTWNAPGFRLQEATALGTGAGGATTWGNSTRVSGTAFTPAGTNVFYRLINP